MSRASTPDRLEGVLTVRLSARALRALKKRARAQGASPSELVRALVEREVTSGPAVSAWELSRQWVGALRDGSLPTSARSREALSEWDPDRR